VALIRPVPATCSNSSLLNRCDRTARYVLAWRNTSTSTIGSNAPIGANIHLRRIQDALLLELEAGTVLKTLLRHTFRSSAPGGTVPPPRATGLRGDPARIEFGRDRALAPAGDDKLLIHPATISPPAVSRLENHAVRL